MSRLAWLKRETRCISTKNEYLKHLHILETKIREILNFYTDLEVKKIAELVKAKHRTVGYWF